MFTGITRSATAATLRNPRVYGPAVSMLIYTSMLFMVSIMLIAVSASAYTHLVPLVILVAVLRPECRELVEGVRYHRKWARLDADAVVARRARMASGFAVPRG